MGSRKFADPKFQKFSSQRARVIPGKPEIFLPTSRFSFPVLGPMQFCMLARFRRLLCLFAVGCAGPLLAEQSAWADDTSNENPDLGALKKMSLEELSQLEVISVSR